MQKSIIHSSNSIIGILMVLVSSIAFSSKAIMVKLSFAYPVDVTTLIALRMLFSVPFFVALIIWIHFKHAIKSLSLYEIAIFLFIGVVTGYGSMWLNFEGLKTVSAGLERVILFLYPTMVVLLNAVVHQHKISKYELIALFMSYIGVLLVVGHDVHFANNQSDAIILGAGFVFASAFVYAVYLVLSGRLIPKFGALTYTAYGMIIIAMTSSLHFLMTENIETVMQLPAQVFLLSLLMALVATVLPALLLNMGI